MTNEIAESIATCFGICLGSLNFVVGRGKSAPFPTDPNQILECTSFQTGKPWTPQGNLRSDVAIVYGIDTNLPARIETWRAHGYRIHVMTGVAWGQYQDYLYGRFDGINHEDEAQTDKDGHKIGHGGDVYYMCPGTNYGKFLCVGVRRALDAGTEAIHLEEPEFWDRAGYSEGFKREWRGYYHEDWQAPDSPDQNAKISAIEIVKQDEPASTGESKPFVITTVDGKSSIAIDTSAAPELTDWAEHKLAPALAEWYPKIVALLPSEGFIALTNYTVTVKDMDGVAYTSGADVSVSKQWIQDQMNGEAIGSLVHESVHVVQQYPHGDAPGWIVEGMADYVRWFRYEPQSHGADIVWMRKQGKTFSPHYDDSYRVSANFLSWVTEKYDSNAVTEVNAVVAR